MPALSSVHLRTLMGAQRDMNPMITAIENAFTGKAGSLGMIEILGVGEEIPQYLTLRRRVLSDMRDLSQAPRHQLEMYTRPHSQFSIGWSRGVEKFSRRDGADVDKASFYAHALSEHPYPSLSPKEAQLFPQFSFANVWPEQLVPEMRDSFLGMSRVLHAIGTQLALCLDAFMSAQHSAQRSESLHKALMRSVAHKGRALYYYPSSTPVAPSPSTKTAQWCGLHADHGILTGLVPSLLFDESPSWSPERVVGSGQGLHVMAVGDDEASPVELLEDSIAFQLGEAAQIMTRGVLRATPHMVKKELDNTESDNNSQQKQQQVSRASFALFLQPAPHYAFSLPAHELAQVAATSAPGIPKLEQRLNPNMSFGDFSRMTLLAYNNYDPTLEIQHNAPDSFEQHAELLDERHVQPLDDT